MTKTATIHAQQRWEYMSISRKTDSYLAGELNILGQEGWELVTINYARGKKEEMFWTAFLKRPAVGAVVPGAAHHAAAAAGAETSSDESRRVPAESLQGFDVDGDTFEIHEEPKKPAPSQEPGD
ncbi:MAG: hypothetical protein GXX96_08970 [Planctomycetaceae bacterium]|nr:hypothetical protein [Planctomycetaceae bacterium]